MDPIIKEAHEALQTSYDFDRDNRREAMEDLRFIAGFQWSDAAKAERKGRSMITINRSAQFLRQVANPIRQNMPTIKVEPDGDSDSELAEVANGLVRRVQYNSSASHVYAQAVEHMVACGVGWFRVVTDYLDQRSFDQEIMIKRVFHPLSVYPDPSSLEPDRSNMNWCVVSELWPKHGFEKKYKGKKSEGFDAPSNGANGVLTWGNGDYVRVGEFWRREETPLRLVLLKDGSVHDLATFTNKGLEYLKFNGLIAGERASKAYRVTMTLVSGAEQLEETYECPCQWIPIIPVIGSEIPLEQGVYRHGLVRFQREPQQLQNYFMSLAADLLGQQPKSPFIVTKAMIENYKNVWDNANTEPTPYLPYDPDVSAPGGPQRLAPPPLPSGLIQMAQLLAEDMKATTGIYDAALGNKSNETSGVAIGARIEQGNQATYHFADNLEHGLEHLGRIMLDMMPKVYDTQRMMRLVSEDGTETNTAINTPAMNYDGEPVIYNDITQMNFKSVRVTLGASYATRRAETAQNMLQLAQNIPMVGEIGADLIVKNLDFEGAEDLSKRLKAILPPQVMQVADPEGFAAMQQAMAPQPDPMGQVQMQGQAQMMDIELQSAQARTAQEQGKAEEQAARVEGAHLDNALKVKKLREPAPRPAFGFDGNRAR